MKDGDKLLKAIAERELRLRACGIGGRYGVDASQVFVIGYQGNAGWPDGVMVGAETIPGWN